jgi:hypothetical protein
MSDYGEDDYSDYGEEWFYIEDEYLPADDLAEHVVNSPPPTAYADEDAVEDWDRFDYWNDLEYASDGYDDGTFNTYASGEAKAGQKRKRGAAHSHSKKKQKLGRTRDAAQTKALEVNSPIVWRSQTDRGVKPKLLDDKTEPYAFLKNWRELLADTPAWASGTPGAKEPKLGHPDSAESDAPVMLESVAPTPETEGEEDQDDEIAAEAVLASIKKNLAAAGGPLSGMDPEEILAFAMRMMGNQDATDDIVGELTDNLLNQGGEEEDDEEEYEDEAPADLLSWLAKHKEPSQVGPSNLYAAPATSSHESPRAQNNGNQPPTPPSSEANRSIRATEDFMDVNQTKLKNFAAFGENNAGLDTAPRITNRKRKADTDHDPENVPKKRATRSYHAPTAASQVRAVPAKASRSGRAKRS